jgi:hypothetical protein
VVEIAITSGIARPSACGQATTSVVTTRSTTNEPSAPSAIQTTAVTTPGADGDERQEERRAVRQRLRPRARGLRLLDQPHDPGERGLRSPVFVTSTRSEPSPFEVPAITSSPSSCGPGATRR